jgi:hypothetical protein
MKNKGFTIKTTPDPRNPVDLRVHGSMQFDEALTLTLTALKAFLYFTKDKMEAIPEDPQVTISEQEKDETIRAVLYDKTVMAFSYVMDEFFPKAKELKAKEDGFEEFIKRQLKEGETK